GIASVPSPAQTLARGHREIKRTARSRKLPPRRGVKRQAGRQTVRSGETFTRSLLQLHLVVAEIPLDEATLAHLDRRARPIPDDLGEILDVGPRVRHVPGLHR